MPASRQRLLHFDYAVPGPLTGIGLHARSTSFPHGNKRGTTVATRRKRVTELVAQQKAMHVHMGEMHQHMMGMGGMMMHR